MVRALLLAAVSTVATGLHLKDGPDDGVEHPIPFDDDLMTESNMSRARLGAGAAAILDPEGWGVKMTRNNPNPFHITQPGEYLMIGIPAGFDYDRRPAFEADLVFKAELQQSGIADKPCDDLMVKKITIEGWRIGPHFKKIEFGIATDAYPGTPESYAAIYMSITWTSRNAVQMFSDTVPRQRNHRYTKEFPDIVPWCTLTPLPFKNHSKKIYKSDPYRRNRVGLFRVECDIGASAGQSRDKQSKLLIQFNSVYYAKPGEKGPRATLENDMHVSLANVGKDPDGLLGTGDISAATNETNPGNRDCKKMQPVNGPYQYEVQADGTRRQIKKGPKHPFGPHHY